MKITIITPSYRPDQTGLADGSWMLAHALHDQPDLPDISVLARQSVTESSSKHGIGTNGRVPVERVMMRCDWRGLDSLLRTLRSHPPDIIHIEYQESDFEHHPMLLALPGRLKRESPKSHVFMRMHDLIVPAGIPRWERFVKSLDWPPRRLGPKSTDHRFLACMLKSVDGVIVCNDHDKKKLHEKILPLLKANSRLGPGLARGPQAQYSPGDQAPGEWPSAARSLDSCRPTIQMIPIGSNIPRVPISSSTRSECRQELGCSDRDVVLVYFGFIQEGKGAADLLQVFDRIAIKHQNTRLLILGAIPVWDSQFGSRYQVLIDGLKCRDRIVWKPYLPADQVSCLFQCADAAILPFRTGAILNRGTLIACISHGLPVVTTQGIYPLGAPFVDGENILMAPAADMENIRAKVNSLIESPALRNRISRNAGRAARYFGWSAIGQAHLDFYQGRLRGGQAFYPEYEHGA